jgi:DNA polymerase III sliding clamp (beta) subunit (PCNA family)
MIEFTSKDLNAALSSIPAPVKNQVSVLGSYRFTVDGDAMTIKSTDSVLFGEATIPIKNTLKDTESFDILLTPMLIKALGLGTKEYKLAIKDTKVHNKANKAKASFVTPEDWFDLDFLAAHTCVISSQVAHSLKTASLFASPERPPLAGVHLNKRLGTNNIMATDGHRAYWETIEDLDMPDFMLPLQIIPFLGKGDVTLSLSSDLCAIKIDADNYSVTMSHNMTTDFPHLEQIYPSKYNEMPINVSKTIETLKFIQANTAGLCVSLFSSDGATYLGHESDIFSVQETISESLLDNVELGFNPKYLLPIFTLADDWTMCYNGFNHPVLFNNDNISALVMPIQIRK